MLRSCLAQVSVTLSCNFMKDLAWFHAFLLESKIVFIIHDKVRDPVCLYVDAYTTRRDSICTRGTCHEEILQCILWHNYSIWHLEVLNAVVALKLWAPKFQGQLLHLFCDNATTVAIFQPRRGRDAFLSPSLCQRGVVHLRYLGHHPGCGARGRG